MLSRRRFVALALLLALGACSAIRPKPPEVALTGVRFVELGLTEQRFALTLRVQNPNPRDFVINGLAYQAEVGGKPFAQGVSNRRVVLPAYGETLLEVPATARLAHFLGGLDAWFGKSGELDYRVHGTIEVEGLGTLPFDRQGKIRLVPERKAPAPGATRI